MVLKTVCQGSNKYFSELSQVNMHYGKLVRDKDGTIMFSEREAVDSRQRIDTCVMPEKLWPELGEMEDKELPSACYFFCKRSINGTWTGIVIVKARAFLMENGKTIDSFVA